MKSRWLLNLALLALIVGIATFLYLRPQQPAGDTPTYEVSTLKMGDFDRVSIEFPAKAPVAFEKIDGYWYLVKPFKARAEQRLVQGVLSIIAGTTIHKFAADDLVRVQFGEPLQDLPHDPRQKIGCQRSVTELVRQRNPVEPPIDHPEAATVVAVEDPFVGRKSRTGGHRPANGRVP